jgi:hypothetical protein
MSDPQGSPAIKAEPQDHTDSAPLFKPGEIIDLISDDEGEVVAPTKVRPLGSPFDEQTLGSKSHDAINLGPSIMFTKPKPVEISAREAFAAREAKRKELILATQRETKARFNRAAQPSQRTPLPVGRSEMFVTESNPGTPDPAEESRASQRDVQEKRRNGTLTWQEEIQFERAEAAEKARLNKERLDQAYDGSDDAVSVEEDLRMSLSVASLPDDDDLEPKRRGRKRKADLASKSQPKKRRAAPKSTEEILATTRRKMEAKAKVKASKGEKQAPKKQCRKAKPTVPDLLNTASMLGNNVFEDTARMRDAPDQPTFEGDSRKDQALRSLIASVPEEYRHVAKTDKKFLEDGMVISTHPLRTC